MIDSPKVSIRQQIEAVARHIKVVDRYGKQCGMSGSEVAMSMAHAQAALRSLEFLEVHRDRIVVGLRKPAPVGPPEAA